MGIDSGAHNALSPMKICMQGNSHNRSMKVFGGIRLYYAILFCQITCPAHFNILLKYLGYNSVLPNNQTCNMLILQDREQEKPDLHVNGN